MRPTIQELIARLENPLNPVAGIRVIPTDALDEAICRLGEFRDLLEAARRMAELLNDEAEFNTGVCDLFFDFERGTKVLAALSAAIAQDRGGVR